MVGAGPSAADSAVSVTPASGTSSTKMVAIKIPSGATCSLDDTGGKNQYQVFPYVIPASKSPQSVRLTAGAINSSAWFINDTATSFAAYVPGAGNHSVAQPANLDPAAYVINADYGVAGADLQPGTYNVGVMCIDLNSTDNPSGAPDIPGNGDSTQDGHANFWNTQFTFTTAAGSTPAAPDFTWTADTNGGSTTTTTTTTTKPSTTTTLPGHSTTTTSVAGAGTTSTTASNAGTTTTLVAGATAGSGGSGSAGAAGGGSGGGSTGTGSAGDAPSSQLAATGASDLPEQMLIGASLAFGGLFILSFAYPRRRPRSSIGRPG
jgi:hypothetical protein